MPKNPSLAEALRQVKAKDPEPEPAGTITSGISTPGVPPSRQGKKAITGHFDPAVSQQLKRLALDRQTTVQALLAEALNDIFEKHHCKPIA